MLCPNPYKTKKGFPSLTETLLFYKLDFNSPVFVLTSNI